jgi:methionine-rich copper-binding protein CopC
VTHLLTALCLAGLATFALAASASAHASLVSADPPAGGTLTSTPFTLTATFDEELSPEASSIVVESPARVQVATGTVSTADDKTMTADLPSLPAGTYTVRWTAVTADDLAVERGTYTFSVGSLAASATPMTTSPPPVGAAGSGNDLVIALVLAAIAIVGVLAFLFVRGRR